MATMTFSLLILSLLSLLLSATSSPLTAHAELAANGFPAGLLPAAVRTYTINQTSGEFAVVLGRDCQVTLPPDNYVATYAKTVTGKIFAGKITDLSGIRVWAFFKWWGLTGIRSNGQDLVFEVGVVSAKYPVNNFGESPQCEGNRASS